MSKKPEKRPYTMSPQAIEQRRANQPSATEASRELSTGPKTEEGKAASSRNNWQHGRYSAINRAQFGVGAASVAKLFGKPCQTTCPYHPDNPQRTEMPCGLVLDGLTHAGGSCLDKTVYVHALESLMAAMQDGEMDGMHGLLAKELAANLQLLDAARASIAEHGVMIAEYLVDKQGNAVMIGDKPIVADMKLNPAFMAVAKFSDVMGLNFAELMATPRAREKLKDDNEAASALQTILGGIAARMGKRPPPRALEHDDA
jgi:hypothetical protein